MKQEVIHIPVSPLQRYELDLEQGNIMPDPAQAMAIRKLELLHQRLLERWHNPPGMLRTVLGRLLPSAAPRREPIRGLYFWGGVGRGKTYLMDLFFHCLPGERKLRMHFHRFMQMVHRGLHQHRGEANPLALVADGIARRADVLCFDEFFVSDIGDAMILANLLEALFGRGVTLVATSNIEPARLYENGLQRQKFLPAIGLLESHCEVVNVDGGVDYRLRSLERAEIYHCPLDHAADEAMRDAFDDLTRGMQTRDQVDLEVLGRDITARHWAEGVAWFDFYALCDGPRSAADYIEIAQLFHTVLVSGVPVMRARDDDQAKRFVTMVDELYDHSVKLILSAAAPVDQLYQGSELAFPFQRTVSRLLEMQSHDYLARQHAP